jgi:DNA-binding IclR family transcriptional regulator
MARTKGSNGSANDKLLDVFEALTGMSQLGIRPSELAKAVCVSPSWVTVNMARYAQRGWVERIEESGNWRLGRKFAEAASVELAELDKADRRLQELTRRWAKGE